MAQEEENEEETVIVIDSGSHCVKSGFATDKTPRSVIPSVIGQPKHNEMGTKDLYIGDDALSKENKLALHCVIENGIIANWDEVEKIWNHVLINECNVKELDECNLLFTESPNNPKNNRLKYATVAFETFNVASMFLSLANVLSLYAVGKTQGLVLDFGDGKSNIVPINDGYALRNAITASNTCVTGDDLSYYLLKNLKSHNQPNSYISYEKKSIHDRNVVRDIKEKLCYVAENYHNETQASLDTIESVYRLPDGTSINVGVERFKCGEALFQPAEILHHENEVGIHEHIAKTILKCHEYNNNNDNNENKLESDLLNNIVLTGGTCQFAGLKPRLLNELKNKFSNTSYKINILPGDNNNNKIKYLAFIGGCVFSKTSLTDYRITKDEYDEVGPNIVQRKCF